MFNSTRFNVDMQRRFTLLLWCAALALISYVTLDFWHGRNAPLYKKLERQWAEDVNLLEESGKLPQPWFKVKEIEIIGGTPETRALLKRIKKPVGVKNENGSHKLEVLVVIWEEEGKRGTMIQYNLVDLKSGNTIWELGRTLIHSRPDMLTSLKGLVNQIHR
jgi:hypothetical protein